MDKILTMNILVNLVRGMSKLLGDHVEIALHDIKKQKIIHIEKGHVTDRHAMEHTHPAIYKMIEEHSDAEGHLIGYSSKSRDGKNLRSSHFIVRDDEGKPFALICINQDISNYMRIRDEIDELIGTVRLSELESPDDTNDKYIQQLTKQIILEEIERAKPMKLDTKESKMEVIRRLDAKGVFLVKDAVPHVCEMLMISQATLYNYQREIRTQQKNTQPDDFYRTMMTRGSFPTSLQIARKDSKE